MATPKPGSNKKTTSSASKQPSSSNKNRVVAARPPKTPAPPSSAAHSKQDSDSESIVSVASSASSQRSGLPIFIQKQLAQDIEEAGGIQAFKGKSSQLLSTLCNANEDVYGKRGDPVRKKITKKVAAWKYLDETEYADKVLNRLQIKSASTIFFETQNTNKVKYDKKISLRQFSDDDDDDNSSISDEEDSSVVSLEIPRRILFSNEDKSATMQSPPPPSQSTATPMGSGKFLFVSVID
jgi:hypothetical protein